MGKKSPKRFNKSVGVFTIIGAIATVVGVIVTIIIGIFTQNKNPHESNNFNVNVNQQSGEITINNIDIEGDLDIIYNYNNSNKEAIADNSNVVLYQRLKDAVSDEIICFVPNDFDDDGKNEAFALVGHCEHYSDFGDVWEGIPYFINEQKITKLPSSTRTGNSTEKESYWGLCRELELGKHKAIVFSLFSPVSITDEIYGVKNGMPVRYEISNVYGRLEVTDNFMTLTVDAYDSSHYIREGYWLGHTWKSYYFFGTMGLMIFVNMVE